MTAVLPRIIRRSPFCLRLALRWFCSGICAVALVACAKHVTRSEKIAGDAPGALPTWRATVEPLFTGDEWREFDASLVELRWAVQRELGSVPAAEVTAAVATKIAGQDFQGVLREGAGAKLARLRGLRRELGEFLVGNELLVTFDESSADKRAAKRREQEAQRAQLNAEIATTERRIGELGGTVTTDDMASAVEPEALSREQALQQIAGLIAKRRSIGVFNYGAWPVRFDLDESTLSDSDREELSQLRAALAPGEVVVPVRLKGKWHFYHGRAEPPSFTRTITANLTAEDLRRVGAEWQRLVAELAIRREESARVVETPEPPR